MVRCMARAGRGRIAACGAGRNTPTRAEEGGCPMARCLPYVMAGLVPAIHSAGHTPTGLAEKDARIKSDGHDDMRKGAEQKERGPALFMRLQPCSAHTSASGKRDFSGVGDTRMRDIPLVPPVPRNPAYPTQSQLIPVHPGESHLSHLSRRIPSDPTESRLSHFVPVNPAESQLIPHAIVPSVSRRACGRGLGTCRGRGHHGGEAA